MGTNRHDGVFIAPDSETSESAAAMIAPRVEQLENLVLEAIRRSGTRGLADFEIDQLLVEHLAPGATARPRRCSLRDKGLISKTGDSVLNPATNRRSSLWAMASHVFERPPVDPAPAAPAPTPDRRLFDDVIESALRSLSEDIEIIRRSQDLDDHDRLCRLEQRFGRTALYLTRQADQSRLRLEWQNDRQSGFNFMGQKGN